jgi:predicted TIM-barrel fold metal-dependent hydrolase
MVAIIDTHQHFFDFERFRYPWLDDDAFAALRVPYLLPDLLADVGNVDVVGTVYVQALVDLDADPVLETAWVQSVADGGGPRRLPSAIVGYADLRQARLEDTLARHCQHSLFRGIRQLTRYEPKSEQADLSRVNLLTDSDWQAGYRTLARFGLSFDMVTFPWQLPDAARLVGSVPDVPVVLEHLGLPRFGDTEAMAIWRTGLRAFAAVDHAHLKISALGELAPLWTTATMRPIVLEAIDTFGVDRCMFGSNYPVEKLSTPYETYWSALGDITASLSGDERNKLFNGNAERFYRIDRQT